MATKISLTPQAKALAEADFGEVPEIGADMAIDGLEEVAETSEEGETPSEDDLPPEDDQDYYEKQAESAEEAEEEVSEDEAGPSWLDDETKAYGRSYGLSDEDLAQFDSKEQLEKFGQMTDRRLASQPAYQEYQQSPPAPQKEQPPEPESTDSQSEAEPDEELIDIEAMREQNYDTFAIKMAERINAKTIEDRKRAEAEAESIRQKAERDFHGALNELDEAVFGTMGSDGQPQKLNRQQEENRKAVYSVVEKLYLDLQNQAQRTGQPMDVPMSSLVGRATRMVFNEDVNPRESQERTERVKAQSRKRRPSSSPNRGQSATSKGPVSPETGDEDVAAIVQSPQMRAFWEKTQRQNGLL